MQRIYLAISLITTLLLSACGSNVAKLQQQKINTVQADALNTQGFSLQLLQSLKSSGANSILKIQAHEGRPITIDAKSLEVSQPIDLVDIFNSEAFRRDWSQIFPPTKNGWDAFIATLDTIKSVATKDTPWLAGALTRAVGRIGNNFTGDGNSVATDQSTLDKSVNNTATEESSLDQSDNSNNSDNSDNSDNSVTEVTEEAGADETDDEPVSE